MQRFWQNIAEILLLSRLEKRWQKVARFLAVVVVFCTTYMLILPAITMEMETYCGIEEHSHEESCYEVDYELSCTYEDSAVEEETTTEIQATQAETTVEPEETVFEEETTLKEETTAGETTTEETIAEETITEEITAQETTMEESATEEATTEETTAEIATTEEVTTEETTSEQTIAHVHTSDCYVENKKLICTAQEHTHSEICFDVELAEKYSVNLMADSLSDENAVAPLAETELNVNKVNFDTLDGSSETAYIVYTSLNNKYYALDGNGKTVSITVNSDGSISSTSMGNDLFWHFTLQSGSSYLIQNIGTSRYMHSYSNSSTDYGVTTSGAYPSSLETTGNGTNKIFRVKSNSNYSRIVQSGNSAAFQTTSTSGSAAQFYIAKVDIHCVWFDGTCGGLMSLYEAGNTRQIVPYESNTITLPLSCQSPSKYDYTLNGWYDIRNHKYYNPGEQVIVTKNMVFYADWVAKTYDIGQFNDKVVDSLDTNSFISTNMFDYSAVFNMQAVTHTGYVNGSNHDETWSVVRNANVPYNSKPSLGFTFRDWDKDGKHISYASNRARLNNNIGDEITTGIIDYVYDMSGRDIIDILFNPETDVIGKTYVGEANYLYQFMDEDSENYDGKHNGYYYYDATLNAASYNQSDKRFYIYNYLERTSDSEKDSFDSNGNPTADGAYSDFLPFNSPYVNNSNNKEIEDYTDSKGNNGNYQYDAKATDQFSEAENAGTNYWFGMKSEIKFYLPNDVGNDGMDEYGNYGNISTHGEHMNFQFHGDDDIWVFIDGELVMDIGGLHGIMTGKIDFSTGTITTSKARDVNETTAAASVSKSFKLKEGDHTLTIYYMERGGSQSNCAIYFNISPRYGMQITKKDALSDKLLNGAEFTVYTDKSCDDEKYQAALWDTEQEYQNDRDNQNKKSTFTVKDGVASFWGISPGKIYYIKETKPPDGYPATDDIIRVAMNNLGGTVCTIDSLTGVDNNHTDGFDIRESSSDEEERMLYVVLTNQVEKTEEAVLTNVRVTKSWGEGSQDIPKNITVYLTADGKIVGKTATLSEANGWTHTWTGLPQNNDEGDKIIYGVQEVQIPGYTGEITASDFNDSDNWFKTDAFRDRDTFLLVSRSSGQALSVSGNSLTWVDRSAAESNVAAQWMAIADGMGFYLENGNGKRLVIQLNDKTPTKFIVDENSVRTLYFYNSKLFAQQNNIYYYFTSDSSASSTGGLEFDLYKKSNDDLSGELFTITNTPVEKKNQTFVNVKKTWSDGNTAHMSDSITVRLYADGKDTGRTLKLNSSNNWAGTFDGLLYSHDGSDTPITYTVAEEVFNGYVPEYSEIISVPGGTETEEITTTGWGTATSLKAGNTYRFVNSNGYALTANSNNTSVSTAADNPNDAYQQWIYESGRLKNVGKSTNSNYYLYLGGNSFNRTLTVSTSTSSSYTSVSLSSQKLRIGSGTTRYINLETNGVSLSSNSSVSVLSVYTWDTITTTVTYPLPPGCEITVNNIKAAYVLPETGGEGTKMYIIGGLLTALSSVFLLCYIKKDRGRRRKCSKV